MKPSNAFLRFGQEAPATAAAHQAFVEARAQESALDPKTRHLAYLAVLAASGLTSGIGFHVTLAKQAGATREEIISAALVGMPAVGLQILGGFAAVVEACDE
jgi:alkylhydroperoxidase/carboxymuconolactone decarboxylase family protein YurZ